MKTGMVENLSNNMRRVFISYSWKDQDYVRSIIEKFRTNRIEYWIDYEELNLDRPLEPQIESGIQQSTFFLLFESNSSLNSKWVQFELEKAYEFINDNQILFLNRKSENKITEHNSAYDVIAALRDSDTT